METNRALATLMAKHPVRLAHELGYDLLREGLHDRWIHEMVFGHGDMTLQSHRGSYKTTCVEVARVVDIAHASRLDRGIPTQR